MSPAANSPSPSPASPASQQPRSVWVVLILLTAVIIGAGAGLVAYVGGANISTAVLTGGEAFGGAVLLSIALLTFGSGTPE